MAIIEANIDDMNPEFYGLLFDKFFTAGAVDVFLSPIIMKKGRPANKLTVLSPPKEVDSIVEIFFKETTSIGLRINWVEKRFLPREIVEVETPWGDVKAKACYLDGKMVNLAPEFEDCKSLSQKTGVPIKRIYQSILKKQD